MAAMLEDGADTLAVQRSVQRYLDRFPAFDADAIETNMAITHASQSLNRALERYLLPEGLGLNRAQYNFLAVLYLAEGQRLALSEISREMNVTPAYITKLLSALEESGLVERLAHPSDRRITYAHLTAEGDAHCATLVPAYLRFMEDVGRRLTTAERDELKRLLAKCRAQADAS